MAPKYKTTAKGRIAPNGYRLCDPLAEGTIILDTYKKQWRIGKTLGVGGFGEIYLVTEKDSKTQEYAMKLDNSTGPLYVEVNFVLRACQQAKVDAFKAKKKLGFLGIPRFISWGTYTSESGSSYRFLVMQRLGEELEKILEKHRLSVRTVCRITCTIIDSLEYIHEQGYIHADIKAQNILRIFDPSSTVNGTGEAARKRSSKRALSPDGDIEEDDRYYLIDYGLAERFLSDGQIKPYEQDKRKANNGTCEFRSRDAHIGVISRRSDIESLGFNLILWFYGRHPWGAMKNPEHVFKKKTMAMEDIEAFLEEAFGDQPLLSALPEEGATSTPIKTPAKKATKSHGGAPPRGLEKFFYEVRDLAYENRPDYDKFKRILMSIADQNDGRKVANKSGKAAKNDQGEPQPPGRKKKALACDNDVDVIDSPAPANGNRFNKKNGEASIDKRLKANRAKVDKKENENVSVAIDLQTPPKRRLKVRLSTPFMAFDSSSSIHDTENELDDGDDYDDFEEKHLRRSRIYINNERCKSKQKLSNADASMNSTDDWLASTSSSINSYLEDTSPIVIMNERRNLRSSRKTPTSSAIKDLKQPKKFAPILSSSPLKAEASSKSKQTNNKSNKMISEQRSSSTSVTNGNGNAVIETATMRLIRQRLMAKKK